MLKLMPMLIISANIRVNYSNLSMKNVFLDTGGGVTNLKSCEGMNYCWSIIIALTRAGHPLLANCNQGKEGLTNRRLMRIYIFQR